MWENARVHLFGVQLNTVWEDPESSFLRARRLIESRPPPPGSLLVLPEMFATGFSMNTEALCGAPAEVTERFLGALAVQYRSLVIGGLPARDGTGHPRNTAVAFDPEGRVLARYHKIHPFSLGGEDRHYAAGESVMTFEFAGWHIAPFICYDLRFPELFRAAAGRGAELFVVIANWPIKRVQHWITLLQARAIENQAWVVGINRTGTDPEFTYPGRSLVVDPHGVIVADANDREAILETTLDHEIVVQWRRDFPALRDMRPIGP